MTSEMLTFKAVRTLPERCRVCYTCVRECPAKAIRIIDGQATVLHERCIGCGNCVRVCSQGAKVVVDSIEQVRELLAGPRPAAAIVAPSFPAEFGEEDYRKFVGRVRALGFARVCEVAFGADLVAAAYRELLAAGGPPQIATSCPAIVLYVEKYYPQLLDALAPIVSPMVAAARALRKLSGEDLRIVFIGPCTSKKIEGVDDKIPQEIDAVLTFRELRTFWAEAGLDQAEIGPSDFDPPHGRLGALFPLHGGMLQAADIREDLIAREVVTSSGSGFTTAISEFASGGLDTRILEILACDGCIMGAGMQTTLPPFRRRVLIGNYVRDRMRERAEAEWREAFDRCRDLDLSRTYTDLDQRIEPPESEEITAILRRMGKLEPSDELNCGACGYPTCREHAVAIHKGLAESEMCLPYTIDRLNETVVELARSHGELASAQEALMQSERLASMGQLAAGIAHEVNNPLGVVLMYAHILLDELEEDNRQRQDARLIVEQAERCKKIVSGLLHFSRQNKVLREPADIRELAEKARAAVLQPEGVEIEIVHEPAESASRLDRDQILQVLTNLLSNAVAAMPEGGKITIRTGGDNERVFFSVADTGVGVPPENRVRIFDPFFTTKQIGKGTGLGLAISYGIVKMHRGEIAMESNSDPAAGPTGSTFTVTLPRREKDVR
ncbi:MAG: [Fe-Fe] hydrogenase large subunit C-terminal domain-containing protein [Candidatus Erginobacter occultus]|nr:[Fe-Fe] hydrogenase large subunit C-terminal domain-containing protein [Candidatus Erginobacter occultus]